MLLHVLVLELLVLESPPVWRFLVKIESSTCTFTSTSRRVFGKVNMFIAGMDLSLAGAKAQASSGMTVPTPASTARS